MKLPAIVIFDLFDTVLKTEYFSFDRGLDYIFENIITTGTTREALDAVAKKELNAFKDRTITHKEIKFIDELNSFKNKLGFRSDISISEIEYEAMVSMGKETLIEDAIELIKYYYKKGIPMYILSNSIFSSNALKRYLDSFGILDYFIDVFSSSDFGYRKPHKSFFEMIIKEIQKNNDKIKKNDIYFIGNDYNSDVKGSSEAGLVPIWYNINNQEDFDKINCKIINSFSEMVFK